MVNFRTSVAAYHLSILATYLTLVFALRFFFLLFLLKFILILVFFRLNVRILGLNKKLQFGICVSFFPSNWGGLIAEDLLRIILPLQGGLFFVLPFLCLLCLILNVIFIVFRVLCHCSGALFSVCVFTFVSQPFLPFSVVTIKIPFSSSRIYQHSFWEF